MDKDIGHAITIQINERVRVGSRENVGIWIKARRVLRAAQYVIRKRSLLKVFAFVIHSFQERNLFASIDIHHVVSEIQTNWLNNVAL